MVIAMITGYRAWRVTSNLESVESIYTHAYWHDRTLEAKCIAQRADPLLVRLWHRVRGRNHRSPSAEDDCISNRGYGCGIYAYLRPEDAFAEAWLGRTIVFGRVSMWGRVVPHSKGYRAQWCRIEAVIVPGDAKPTELELAVSERYGVPIERIPKESLT